MAYVFTIDGVTKDVLNGWDLDTQQNGHMVLSFSVASADGSYRPALDQEVVITRSGTRVFGGFITRPTESGFGSEFTPEIITRCEAIDFSTLADRRFVTVTLPSGTLKAALTALLPFLEDVTLDAGQVDGPTIPELAYSYAKAVDVLNDLTAQSDGFLWKIDADKKLSMSTPSAVAPFNITAAAGHAVGDITVEPTREGYANRIILRYSSPPTSAYAFLYPVNRGTPANFSGVGSETITVGSKTYTFVAVLSNIDGYVQVGASWAASLANLSAAINLGSGAGTAYASAMSTNEFVTSTVDSSSPAFLTATARTPGSGGNSVGCSTAAANAQWLDNADAGVSYASLMSLNPEVSASIINGAYDTLVATAKTAGAAGNFIGCSATGVNSNWLDGGAGTITLKNGTDTPAVAAYAWLKPVNLVTPVDFSNGNTVTVGAKTYTFQTTLTNVDGNVLIGGSWAASIVNLWAAINLEYGSAVSSLANGADASLTEVVTADDLTEQAAHGIWEALYSSPDLIALNPSQALADLILARSIIVLKLVHYQTYDAGLAPGQIQTITVPRRNLTGSWLITDVRTTTVENGVTLFEVTALEGIVWRTGGWKDTWKAMMGGSTGSNVVGGLVGQTSGTRYAYFLGGSGVDAVQSPTPTWVPASGGQAIGQGAIQVQVNTVPRGTQAATVNVRLKALDAGVSVQARLYDVTAGAAIAPPSVAVTSTDWVNVSFAVILFAGSHVYELQVLPGTPNADVAATGFLE